MSQSADRDHKTPTDWAAYRAYQCRSCGERCINHLDTARCRYRECASCIRVPDLDHGADDLREQLLSDETDDRGDLDDRQAVDLPSGRGQASERSERDSAPGRKARPRSASEQAGTSPGIRSERSEVQSPATTPIGDALDRLAYRRSTDE